MHRLEQRNRTHAHRCTTGTLSRFIFCYHIIRTGRDTTIL